MQHLSHLSHVHSYKDQSYKIFGKLVPRDAPDTYDDVIEHCFAGFGFRHCMVDFSEAPDDVNVDAPFTIEKKQVWEPAGQTRCLECCSNNRPESQFKGQEWHFECPLDKDPDVQYDVYQHEFRFARRRTLLDLKLVKDIYNPGDNNCELRREPEVQYISTVDTQPIGGHFHLLLDGMMSDAIYFNATSMRSEEVGPRYWPGIGFEQSIQAKLGDSLFGKIMAFQVSNFGIEKHYGKILVTRSGPSINNEYTWSITFLDSYHVPLLRFQKNFTNSTTNVTVTKKPKLYLHGYTLHLGVKERGEGLNYWREVTSCNVVTKEGETKPSSFEETIILHGESSASSLFRFTQNWCCTCFFLVILLTSHYPIFIMLP